MNVDENIWNESESESLANTLPLSTNNNTINNEQLYTMNEDDEMNGTNGNNENNEMNGNYETNASEEEYVPRYVPPARRLPTTRRMAALSAAAANPTNWHSYNVASA